MRLKASYSALRCIGFTHGEAACTVRFYRDGLQGGPEILAHCYRGNPKDAIKHATTHVRAFRDVYKHAFHNHYINFRYQEVLS